MAIKAKMAIASKNDFFVISFDFCVGSDTIKCRSHTDLIHRLSFTPFSTNLATM